MAISINTPANFASNNVKCTPVSADIIESVSLENPKRKSMQSNELFYTMKEDYCEKK